MPIRVIIGLTVKVQHEASGKWVRLPLEPQADAAKCFRDLSAEVSRRFGDAKFSLHLHPEKRTVAAPEAQLESAPPGWFVAGNVVGSVLPAQWCRFHGAWVGRAAARHVRTARAD